MGIENCRTVRANAAPACPHYPSWGSKTRESRSGCAGCRRCLITPHGDRKPAPPAACRSGNPELITPHGDRKPRRWRASSAKALCSSHYPSWGSKTGVRARIRRSTSLTSLPLMGIENQPIVQRDAVDMVLITPHGDRKHGAARRRRADPNNSLPLMGIENLDYSPCARRIPQLITPHGDRKLTWDGPVTVNGSPPHYPSWGSKTCR